VIYDQLKEANPAALTLAGFKKAYLGFALQAGNDALAVYDYDKCIDVLMDEENMSREEAMESFAFNEAEEYFGENTPLILVRR
tara:strand:+ start:1862 stop:2110 length:249 start_codon:yes stop_codon:yes gene_type:complete